MISTEARKLKAKELQKELRTWVYKEGTEPPPPLEEAWIIHSQIEWKQENASPETLWEDLPYTDPAVIIFLIEEKEDSPIPPQSTKKLHWVLAELENLGINLQQEFFSLNWSKNKKRHGQAKALEIKKNNKPYKTGKKERMKPTDPQKDKPQKKKAKKGIILSLFGL